MIWSLTGIHGMNCRIRSFVLNIAPSVGTIYRHDGDSLATQTYRPIYLFAYFWQINQASVQSVGHCKLKINELFKAFLSL